MGDASRRAARKQWAALRRRKASKERDLRAADKAGQVERAAMLRAELEREFGPYWSAPFRAELGPYMTPEELASE